MDKVKFLSVKQAAKLIGVHEITMLRYVKDGTVRALRFGHKWQIPADQFEVENGGGK